MRGGTRVKGAGGDYQPLKVSHIAERVTAAVGLCCRDLGVQRFLIKTSNFTQGDL